MEANDNLKDYDVLDCPYCDEPCKPTSVNKKGTVSYKHDCVQGDGFTFKIDINGDLVE